MTSTRRLLVVDDDPEVIEIVQATFAGRDLVVQGAASGEEALDLMSRQLPDAILLDVRLPSMNGLEVCRLLNDRGIDVPIILASSHTSMELTVQAMQEGAFDYLDKPLRPKGLVTLVERALETQEAAGPEDVLVASPPEDRRRKPWELVGRSEAMLEVYKAIGRVAPASSTVLITGESGTGKEVVARAIHEKGSRARQPFEAVNCAAIPHALLEGELFGYEKGAFTGATRERRGKFEAAGSGTLFLDEVGELPSPLQPKLLRVLEERTVDRLGGTRQIPVKARIIAATNRDLEEAVSAGTFREDLYFRLAVVTIRLPPLRERDGDVRRLVDHFVSRLAPEVGRRLERVAPDAYRRLETSSWRGNVRELRNVLERSLILSRGPVLRAQDLPPLDDDAHSAAASDGLAELADLEVPLEEVERRYIQLVLEATSGNLSWAARILGIHRSTLHRKVRRFQEEAT